jgi:hypothetical protein
MDTKDRFRSRVQYLSALRSKNMMRLLDSGECTVSTGSRENDPAIIIFFKFLDTPKLGI